MEKTQRTHSMFLGYLLWIFGFIGAHRFYWSASHSVRRSAKHGLLAERSSSFFLRMLADSFRASGTSALSCACGCSSSAAWAHWWY